MSDKVSELSRPRYGLRHLLVVLIVFGLAAVAGYLGYINWHRFSAFSAHTQDADAWRLSELHFLKAAYDRLETQLAQRPNSTGSAALRSEQDVIRRMMIDNAKVLPPHVIPSEIRAVVEPSATVGQVTAPAIGQVTGKPPESSSAGFVASPNVATLPSAVGYPEKAAPRSTDAAEPAGTGGTARATASRETVSPPENTARPEAAPETASGEPSSKAVAGEIVLRSGLVSMPKITTSFDLSRDPALDRKIGRPLPPAEKKQPP